jgi:antitoxin (DNA-binding transcriptional repressor) of toxin-antitoxin stability system
MNEHAIVMEIYRQSTMSTTIPIDEAQANLKELIHHLQPGEELLIMENHQPVAKLVSEAKVRKQRQPGLCKGMITLMVEDDEHLQGFEEYME